MIRFGVLGPLTLISDVGAVEIGTPKVCHLLAALLCRAGQPVRVHELVDELWADGAPPTAQKTLQVYVHRLRTALGDPARIAHGTSSYAITVKPEELDAFQFADLAAGAHRETEPRTAAQLCRQALDLWRGPAYAGVAAGPMVADEARRLEEECLLVRERLAAAELDLGGHAKVATTLPALIRDDPFREGLRCLLMIALHRSGRRAEALEVYRQTRNLLAEQLGIEPGPALQRLHRAMLAGDDRLIRTDSEQQATGSAGPPGPTVPPDAGLEPGAGPVAAQRGVPRQLPAPPQLFTGRVTELAVLAEIHDASTVVITAIDGMAGIGKTALAVQAAHQLAGRYPDGQLFLDLHGYTHGVAPVEPGEAVDRMLRALGVPGAQIPAGLDERAGLYRSRLADKRMLLVLDNAVTEAQITPLLPGAPGCLVVVTSRRRLAGLDHTHALSLDTLPVADAVTLLRHTAGEGRLAGQPPELMAELVDLCGLLPLAIRIAAARLRSHPTWDLSHLTGRLRDQQHRLAELTAGQRSVTAALDLSYQDLNADQQRMYRRLGLHFGVDIEPYAAAALFDGTLLRAGPLLDQLLEAHILQEPAPGRYRFHDLTRAHAAHTATRDETDDGRRMAVDRLLNHYRHTAAVAMDAAYPYERHRRPQVPPTAGPTPSLSDPPSALRWLDSEMPNLLAAATYATEHGWPTHVLQLSTILHRHLRSRGQVRDASNLHHQALTTARTTGHQAAELDAQLGLGHIHRMQGRSDQAIDHLQRALELARATSHQAAELDALTGLGHTQLRIGRYEQATEHYQQALRLGHASGNTSVEQSALLGLGWIDRMQGRYEQATDHVGQALQLARSTGHGTGELNALIGLGHIGRMQGRYEPATDHYQQALQLAGSTGHCNGELSALAGLGKIFAVQGLYQQATGHYQRLLDLAHETGDHNMQFEARQGLGRLENATGHPDDALTHHTQALALASELGQPDDQARAHDGLAQAHRALHQDELARTHWRQALDILTRLGIDHTEDEEANVATIRAHLDQLDSGLAESGPTGSPSER
jgi:DNA-binding SARP family transcriptional activator/tetratricopeptide (TPR) repeat protein